MIEVDQTILHGNGLRGNCLQACIASIMELDIEEVPHFANHEGADWFDRMNDWFIKRGMWILYIQDDYGFMPHGYSIICGTSPRQVRHSCVALDGKLIFDPHPSRAGLIEVDSYYLFVNMMINGWK